MRKLILAVACMQGVVVVGQELHNQYFKLAFSSAGVTSLKRVQDAYDTDYILAGRTLGDVFVRYRAPGTSWKEATSGTAATNSSTTEIRYKVGRTIPTLATSSTARSSAGAWGLSALNDQIEPKNSNDKDIPFFAWGNRPGSKEWVEYDFGSAKQVSSAEVYWAVGSPNDYKWDLPASWSLQCQEGGQWKDVRTSDKYGLATGQFNHINFEPITTHAMRLTA